jgi:hypothetical protein
MTKEKYEVGTKRGMNWTCPVNKLFLDQLNDMKMLQNHEDYSTSFP